MAQVLPWSVSDLVPEIGGDLVNDYSSNSSETRSHSVALQSILNKLVLIFPPVHSNDHRFRVPIRVPNFPSHPCR